MRKIRRKTHAKDDTQTQVDVAWAVGMRAGIDEGKRQAAMEVHDLGVRIEELERELEGYKSANEALRRYNDQHEKTIKELRKERGNAMDYIKRLESHLDPRVIQTKLLVNSNGEPFNETSGSEKRLLLAGTETGRLSSGGIIDFKHVRPRGRPISREAYQRYAAAYGASEETIRGCIIGADYSESPDETAIVHAIAHDEAERSFSRFQDAAGHAVAQEVDDAIMQQYAGAVVQDVYDPEDEDAEEDDGYEKERNDW